LTSQKIFLAFFAKNTKKNIFGTVFEDILYTDIKCPFCRKFVEMIKLRIIFFAATCESSFKIPKKIVTECVNELGLQFLQKGA
jgi:hypothetical protein